MNVPVEVVDKVLPALRLLLHQFEDGQIVTWEDSDEATLVWERADWAYHELKMARESIPVCAGA